MATTPRIKSDTDAAIRRCRRLDEPTREAIFQELYVLAEQMEREGLSHEHVVQIRIRARAIRWLEKDC